MPAGPGAATGKIYFNADRAAAAAEKGEKVLLVRVETSPEDLRGMIAAEGILTARGGVSSHAALVARQMGKVCVCGASALHIDYRAKTMSVNGAIFREGQIISRSTERAATVYAGAVATAPRKSFRLLHGDKSLEKKSETYRNFNQLMDWCAKVTRMRCAPTPTHRSRSKTRSPSAPAGIGLCRTEHMFFEGDRIDAMREMILADNVDDRKSALAKLLPYQREDFVGIFKALKGLPATIRFLDPPLHEFLPHDHGAQSDLAQKDRRSARKKSRTRRTSCTNSIRCSAIAVAGSESFIPEITEMQARAVFEAAAEVQKKRHQSASRKS